MGPKKKAKKTKAELEAEKLLREEEERKAKIIEEKKLAEETEKRRLEAIRLQNEKNALRSAELDRLRTEAAEMLEKQRDQYTQMTAEEAVEVCLSVLHKLLS